MMRCSLLGLNMSHAFSSQLLASRKRPKKSGKASVSSIQGTFTAYVKSIRLKKKIGRTIPIWVNVFFKVFVIKGDFLQGELFETFISRSIEDIAAKLNKYFDIISTHQLDNIIGYVYGQSTKNIDDIDIYSAIDKVQRHLTSNEMKELSKSKSP